MKLEEFVKTPTGKGIIAGLAAGAIYWAGRISAPQPKAPVEETNVYLTSLGVQAGEENLPKIIQFQDEKAKYKFFDLAIEVQRAYETELSKNGLTKLGEDEVYQLAAKVSKNTPCEKITEEQVGKIAYLLQKEGKSAVHIEIKTGRYRQIDSPEPPNKTGRYKK